MVAGPIRLPRSSYASASLKLGPTFRVATLRIHYGRRVLRLSIIEGIRPPTIKKVKFWNVKKVCKMEMNATISKFVRVGVAGGT
jgi:hypothetical protein